MRLARDRALTPIDLIFGDSAFGGGRRNEVSPRQGIDTDLRASVDVLYIL